MGKMFFTVLLLVISVISSFGQAITSKEYEIYAAVLKHISKNEGSTPFVILDKTKTTEGWESFNAGTHNDFTKKNKISAHLISSLPINYKYWLVSKNEISALIERGSNEFAKIQEQRRLNKQPLYADPDPSITWKYFNEKYSNAWGYYQFSRVGFNLMKNFAKVEVEYHSEGGFRKTYLLNKYKGKWKVSKTAGVVWSH